MVNYKEKEQEYDIENIKTLDDCIDFVISIQEGRENNPDFKLWLNIPEKEALVEAHHILGQWLRNVLQLWYDGPSIKWFNNIGIYHADDISGIILTSMHRKYNKVDLDIDGQVKVYRDYWDEVEPNVNKGIKN